MQVDLVDLVARLSGQRGARCLVAAGSRVPGAELLPFPDTLPEWLSPLVAIVPAQLFCYHLALAKGLSTEAPRGLSKVTLTR
jgi:glucosamine--fructose-6-phosphate aminotransferase (isomerizing)